MLHALSPPSAARCALGTSRVRSFSGLYLSAFDPKSIMVSPRCLREVNRLRQTYRTDLPLYELPVEPRASSKPKRTGSVQPNQPEAKKRKGNLDTPSKALPTKRKRPGEIGDEKAAKTTRSGNDFEPRLQTVCPLRFYPGDEKWQRNTCAIMGLQFHGKNKVRPGSPNVALKRPGLRTVKRIKPDGNCLFRSFAYIVTWWTLLIPY